jgi:glycosyltransferase involved in cell wall biosynthesis
VLELRSHDIRDLELAGTDLVDCCGRVVSDKSARFAALRLEHSGRPMKVLALTKYGRVAASSRCRFLNYVPLLAQRDISVTVSPLLSDSYVRRRLSAAPINYADVAGSYISRLSAVINSSRFDALWIEGELLPRWPAIFEKLLSSRGKPFIVDLDDAIFHTYDRHPIRLVRTLLGRKIDAVCNLATLVVAGNEYLAERARRAGARRVVIVPTTVDHRAYAEQQRSSQGKLTFGWIGSAATQHYLETIKPELEELCGAFDIRLRLIGVDRHNLKCPDVVLSEWSEETEIAELTACDVGLAPLYDGYWERGKCGLKAIQYMAAGIPQLAANVGALPSIVRHDETGFIYRTASEFKAFASQLIVDSNLRQRMGIASRNRVVSHYSMHSWADTVADILLDAASQPPADRTGRAPSVRASNRAEFLSMDRARQELPHSIRARFSRERVVVYTAITRNYDAVVQPPGIKDAALVMSASATDRKRDRDGRFGPWAIRPWIRRVCHDCRRSCRTGFFLITTSAFGLTAASSSSAISPSFARWRCATPI